MDLINYYEDLRPVNNTDYIELFGEMKDKPETEQRLFKLQNDYYEAKTLEEKQEAWKAMFAIIKDYARSTVLQRLTHKTFLDPDVVETHANQAALQFMAQYHYRKNFKCVGSFHGNLIYKVIETLHSKKNKEEDQNLSLQLENDAGDEFDFLSMSKKMEVTPLWGNSYVDIEQQFIDESANLINELFSEFDEVITDDLIRLKMRMYFLLILKKPKNRHIKEQFIKNICRSKKEIDCLNMMELELFNRYQNYIRGN